MGHFSMSCCITGQSLIERDVVIIPLLNQYWKDDIRGTGFHYATSRYKPLTLPIFGYLGSYGDFTPDAKDENTTFLSQAIPDFDGFIEKTTGYRSRNEYRYELLENLIEAKKKYEMHYPVTEFLYNGCLIAREAWDVFSKYGDFCKPILESHNYISSEYARAWGFDICTDAERQRLGITDSLNSLYIKKHEGKTFVIYTGNDYNTILVVENEEGIKTYRPVKKPKYIGQMFNFMKQNGVFFTEKEEASLKKSSMRVQIEDDFYTIQAMRKYSFSIDRNVEKIYVDNRIYVFFPKEPSLVKDDGMYGITKKRNGHGSFYGSIPERVFLTNDAINSIRKAGVPRGDGDIFDVNSSDMRVFVGIENFQFTEEDFVKIESSSRLGRISSESKVADEMFMIYGSKIREESFIDRYCDLMIMISNANGLNKMLGPTNCGWQDGNPAGQRELIKVMKRVMKKKY